MKKVISFVLAICITVVGLPNIVFADAFSDSSEEQIAVQEQAQEICEELSEVIEEYDDSVTVENESGEECEVFNTRLIVQCDDELDTLGAVEDIDSFGYHILQYDNAKAAKKALDEYYALGLKADYDSVGKLYEMYYPPEPRKDQDYPDLPADSYWHLKVTDAAITKDYYKYRINSQIDVATIDSGCSWSSPYKELTNRLVRTYFNTTTDTNTEVDSNEGHGTRVAYLIMESTPSNVKIHPYKIFNRYGVAPVSAAIAALSYILEQDDLPDIINMSCGFDHLSDSDKSAFVSLIDELIERGTVICAAAGNDAWDVGRTLPACLDEVITVSAYDINGNTAYFSSYGNCVDISAPGAPVVANVLVSNGTSFSTPIVSAAAAIVKMNHSNYSVKQIEEELIKTATPFKKHDCKQKYGAGIVNFSNLINGTRYKDIKANLKEGVYYEPQTLKLSCDSALVNIIYTTDGTLPSKENGTVYSEPIEITESTRIIAAAYPKIGSILHGKFCSFDYNILPEGVSEFMINSKGVVTGYLGSETNIEIPETIDGITPVEIGDKAFGYMNIESARLPESVKVIGDEAFRNKSFKSLNAPGCETVESRAFQETALTELDMSSLVTANDYAFADTKLKKINLPKLETAIYGFVNTPLISVEMPSLLHAQGTFQNCKELKAIDLPELTSISCEAFTGCRSLTRAVNFNKVRAVTYNGLGNSYFEKIVLPNFSYSTKGAFDNCRSKAIKIGKLDKLPDKLFANCTELETVYLSNTTKMGSECFLNCINLKRVFAPMCQEFSDIYSDVEIYLRTTVAWGFDPNHFSGYTETVVAPKYSAARGYAEQVGIAVKETEEINSSLGVSVRLADSGLRFSFLFENIDELESLADNIEYGFVYCFGSDETVSESAYNINTAKSNRYGIKRKNVKKCVKKDGKTTYNLDFTNISEDSTDDSITVRAYVNIDGFCFYSDIVTRSFEEVANTVLNNSDIAQNLYEERWINENKDFSLTDDAALFATVDSAKAFTKAEYTKESIEALLSIVESSESVLEFGGKQNECDAAVTEILSAVSKLDSLSNYNITSFDGKEIELTNKYGKTTSLTFSDFVNENCESLDVVSDGVVNAKDYAYLIKNYSSEKGKK